MRFGLSLPIFDQLADPGALGTLATDAESAQWDGVFVWDHVYYRPPVEAAVDPWIALAVIAERTSSARVGPLVTPIARRRPHVLARQIASLDVLAGGRTILGVGLGLDGSGEEFARFGEGTDVARRRERYDEGLDLVQALLSGEPVDHHGAYYVASDVTFLPRPVRPVPVWVAARWPFRNAWNRAAQHDGVVVINADPAAVTEMTNAITEMRGGSLDGFDVVVMTDAWRDVDAWERAGATWLIPALDAFTSTPATVQAVIEELGRHRN